MTTEVLTESSAAMLGRTNTRLITAPIRAASRRKTACQRRKAYQALSALPLSESIRTRRVELVTFPFVGEAQWVMCRLQAAGLPPPD
ncbi:hypothetical protein ACOQFB_06300 [Anaeromyxobacter sp. Red801]|uniref:hypothetical protein n=1 Tax=Anaeromyxobacter sp. Red801 TaxID=3411632 RepID=UPI003BA00279